MNGPTLAEIKDTRERIDPYVVTTPVWHWCNRHIRAAVGADTDVFLKLELFQNTGTFKPRGALRVMLDLEPDALARGITAVSAGNHAIAAAFAAQQLGTTAKVVMLSTANPARVAMAKAYGAAVEMADGGPAAFERARQIEAEEGRTFVHPFEGPLTSLGTATVALEFLTQVDNLDCVIVPIGGGGLCSGVAAAVKLMRSDCTVYGVEPRGADSMHRSFAAGEPQSIDKVQTIADSLGAPHAAPYGFSLCREFVDELVYITDDDMRRAMVRIWDGVKLAVEPAGAAATAALCGPLRDDLRGQRVGVIVCGSNIDPVTYTKLVAGVDV